MDIQNIIVAVIILAAVVYAGRAVWRKARAFSAKSGCGSGCGCSSSIKQKTSKF